MSERPIIVGRVYAKWCKYCKILDPEWEKMKPLLKKFPHKLEEFEDSNIHKLDEFNNENAEYLHHQKVKNRPFPTIFRIKNGKIEYYEGDRKARKMADWFMGKKHIVRTHKHRGGGGSRRRKSHKIRRTRRHRL